MTLDDIKDRCRIDEDTGCWIWTGAKSGGWPRIWAPDHTLHAGELRTQTGRRAAWHIKTGKPIPSGWRVFGTCTQRDCCNPAHMVCEPTAKQGAKVAASGRLKGRIARITANRSTGRRRSHIDAEARKSIRDSNERRDVLAARHQCSPQTISRIRAGKDLAFQPVGGMFSALLAANENNRKAA